MNVFVVENIPLKSAQPMSVYLTELSRHFANTENLNLNLVVAASSQFDPKEFPAIHKIHFVNSSLTSAKDNLGFSAKAFNALKKEHQKTKIDIVHCIYPNSSLLAAVLFKIFINPKVKIIYNVRSTWIEMIFTQKHINSFLDPLIKIFLNISERVLVHFVDHLVFVSPELKKFYLKQYSTNRIPATISPNGVDVIRSRNARSYLRNKLGFLPDDIVIGYIGSLDSSRELIKFIEYFAVLLKRNSHLKLFFIGNGDDYDRIYKYVCDNNLGDVVSFLRNISHEQIPIYIKTFNFGLCHLPDILAYNESFPQKILEYLACGVPVLASNIKAHQNIQEKLKGVSLYESADDIAQIIKHCNQEILQDMSEYSWESITKTFVNLYFSLLSYNPYP